MKKLILLLSLFVAPFAQAHTFAYQEWYNPATGQILEEYYDVHRTDNTQISPTEHRHNLIERAKNNNALVITEDKPSLHFGGIDYTDTSDKNKQAVKAYMKEFPLDCSLAWSYAECFVNDIAAFNAECRELNAKKPLNEKYEQEIASYNDGAILNNFYKNIKQLSQELAGVNQRGSELNYKCFIVDARALHAVYNTNHKKIMLTMGATHIIRINRLLLQLGWEPRTAVVPTAYDAQQTETLITALTPDAESLHNTLNAWSTYLNDHVDNITNNEIAIATLENSLFRLSTRGAHKSTIFGLAGNAGVAQESLTLTSLQKRIMSVNDEMWSLISA